MVDIEIIFIHLTCLHLESAVRKKKHPEYGKAVDRVPSQEFKTYMLSAVAPAYRHSQISRQAYFVCILLYSFRLVLVWHGWRHIRTADK